MGSGQTVSILANLWLPDMNNAFVESRHPALVNTSIVSLITVSRKEWDTEVITDLFGSRDQAFIHSIQPSNLFDDDSWF